MSAAEAAMTLDFVPVAGDPFPAGWHGGPLGTIFGDSEIVHAGKLAVRIERTSESPKDFSTLTKSIPMNFGGSKIELRGFIRTEDVSNFAGLWLREDGAEGQLDLANMQERQLKGTTGWSEYSITLPLNPAARKLYLGFLVAGTGKAWVDDLQLRVDGKPIWEAPKIDLVQTILDRDHEFDEGSRINLAQLTPVQVESLATLSKVWGFLKYHHPAVTSGTVQWDYELFRIMPAVLGVRDRTAAADVLAGWVDRLGEPKASGRPGPEETDLAIKAENAWIDDETLLGAKLSERLRTVYLSRPTEVDQFYVSKGHDAGNPIFIHELAYPGIRFPDPGYQLLGLFRFWNMIRYWSPYRDLVGENWDEVLTEFIPRIGLAGSSDDYQLQLMALIADVHDTHANLWSSLDVRPPRGNGQLPAVIRFIEGRPVVTGLVASPAVKPSGLERGDVIDKIDGIPVEDLLRKWSPYYAASNRPTQLREIAESMGRGPAGPVTLHVKRGTEGVDVEAVRYPNLKAAASREHDLPGPVFRLLSKDIAYLKLSAVRAEDCASYVGQAEGTKGWIIDARNYPSAFVVFALGSHLVDKPTEFVRFTVGALADPGEFVFTNPLSLQPQAPHYRGRIVILVDEKTQSQAEYTAMAFRSAPGALVVGSTTAGADGNVSQISLPGGMSTMISGIGVFYPDNRPTQRIGIVPDVDARPTVAGIRAARDEVLEEALRQILGAQSESGEIERMAAGRQ